MTQGDLLEAVKDFVTGAMTGEQLERIVSPVVCYSFVQVMAKDGERAATAVMPNSIAWERHNRGVPRKEHEIDIVILGIIVLRTKHRFGRCL